MKMFSNIGRIAIHRLLKKYEPKTAENFQVVVTDEANGCFTTKGSQVIRLDVEALEALFNIFQKWPDGSPLEDLRNFINEESKKCEGE